MRRGLVLAAHGSTLSGANARVEELASRLGQRLGFDVSSAAYHQGEPGFAVVLDQLGCEEVTVVPLMTSRGYYSEVVLPRELVRNDCHDRLRLRHVEPLGVLAGLADLVVARVEHLVTVHELACPQVAIVGHGTPRQRTSREATEAMSEAVGRSTPWRTGAFFLDENPGIEQIRGATAQHDLVVVPFLIVGGAHVARDLRRCLGFDEGSVATAAIATVDDRRVVLDRPVGHDPGIEDLIADAVGPPSQH